MVHEDWLQTLPIAHRGLHDRGVTPENSFDSFEKAIQSGYAIELDVQASKDGKVVVFHDFDLHRMTGVKGQVCERDYQSISKLRLLESDQKIPLFSEVLSLIAGRAPLLIEIKNEGKIGPLEQEAAAILDGYQGPFAVQAFNPFIVNWFRKNRPLFQRGQLSGQFQDRPDIKGLKKLILSRMWFNFISKPHFVNYDIRAGDLRFFRQMKKRLEVPLILWTATDAKHERMCRSLGLNMVFEGFTPSKDN